MINVILSLRRETGVQGVAGVNGVQEWKPGGDWFERVPVVGSRFTSVRRVSVRSNYDRFDYSRA